MFVLIGVLLLVFAALASYHFFLSGRVFSDPDKIRELQAAVLPAEVGKRGLGDWPQWRGPRRDGVSMETGFLTAWPSSGPKKLWSQPAGVGFSSLAVANGRAYTLFQDGPNEAVICWDADNGKELWRFRYPCKYENYFGSGPRATPTVDGDLVFTVGGTGILHCLKTNPSSAEGELVWRKDLLTEFDASNLEWGVSFSPLVEGDLLYTNPGGPNGNSLAAFDKRTGQLKWKALDDPAGYSSPIAVTLGTKRQILFFTGAGLVGVAPDTGALYWRFPWSTNHGCNIATPIAVQDYVFISSGYNRGCAVIKIEPQPDGSLQPVRVYEHSKMCNHFASSVRHQDHLYGFNNTFLTCMNFRTGEVTWKERGFDKGSLLLADGYLIVLGERGNLALAKADSSKFEKLAEFEASSKKCWTVPVLANGRLYVRDEQQVTCFDLRK
jgi:outer membrane protein assembly factor BamB